MQRIIRKGQKRIEMSQNDHLPIDDSFIFDQPEDSRLFVARLRLRRHGAYFHEAKSNATKPVYCFCMLEYAIFV